MGDVRFVAAPRSVIAQEIGNLPGFRRLGDKMLEKAKERCPVSTGDSEVSGPHLRDTLVVKIITGTDPRILVGSARKGDVLRYLTDGTSAHWVEPVNKKALRWTNGGTVYFSKGHEVSGIEPNPFILEAIREAVQEG